MVLSHYAAVHGSIMHHTNAVSPLAILLVNHKHPPALWKPAVHVTAACLHVILAYTTAQRPTLQPVKPATTSCLHPLASLLCCVIATVFFFFFF